MNPEESNYRESPLKIAFYSHDTSGLGHVRRNLLMAKTLARSNLKASILMITGAREVGSFDLPEGIDVVVLPSLKKTQNGGYVPRRLRSSLHSLVKIRAQLISCAIKNFQPDVFIVDQMCRGVLNELDVTLEQLRSHQQVYCVLGLRDILDDPEVIAQEWLHSKDEEYIYKSYNQVWIFGDPNIYNAVEEYGFSAKVAEKTCFTGYLNPSLHKHRLVDAPEDFDFLLELPFDDKHYNLCLLGSGQDGARLAEVFALATEIGSRPGIILAGPQLPTDNLHRLHLIASTCPKLHIIEFHKEPINLIQCASNVIAMGGYNTVCEILTQNKRALIIPRIRPRQEQLIRARKLAELGLLDMLHPNDLSVESILNWLNIEQKKPPSASQLVDFDGLTYILNAIKKVSATKCGNK